MGKQVNRNIGYCTCAECNELSAVRKNARGKLYYDCPDCGRMTPNLQGGQDRVLERAVIYGDRSPPPECPLWIAEQIRWDLVRRDTSKKLRQPVGTVVPVQDAPPNKTNLGTDEPPQPAPPPEKEPEPLPELETEADGFSFLS